jgi:ribosomal protein S26
LGKHNINIAAMTFGRDKPQGKAISVLNVDSPVSAELADKLKNMENILTVKGIRV